MRRLTRLRSLQTNMALAFGLLILATIFMMSFTSFFLTKSAVQDNVQAYTTELVKQVNSNIETYVNGMRYISDLAASNRTIREYLSSETFHSLEEEKKYQESIREFLKAIALSRTDLSSIGIFGSSGRFLTGDPNLELNPFVDIRSQDWYQKALASRGSSVISSSHVQPVFKDRYAWVVTLSRSLLDDEGRELGVFWADLNFSVMNDMLSNISLGKRGYLFIVDQEGKIVYHPQQQLIYSHLKSESIEKVLLVGNGTFVNGEGSDRRMYTVQDSGFGWKIVGVSYVSELVGNQTDVRLSFVVLGLICVVITILLSIYLSRRISSPIKQLQSYMKEVEKGNFDIQVPVPRTIEIGRLARAFNMMVGKIKELMRQVVLDQEQKRKSELSALQAQINPHFLYNTLDSIVWMAESSRNKEVVAMTSALAKLFRSSISKGEEIVDIRTEIEHIESYLQIQKMRYRKKLDYEIDVPEHLQKYYTVKVILQPLVENAIYHGIKLKRGPGLIRVTGKETDGDILLFVSDNGVGMEAHMLDAILLPAADRTMGRGVGVRNVQERLQLYFGAPYGLTFESKVGEGTTVAIRIPKSPSSTQAGGASH